jgi:hypothetical protein
MARPRKKPSKRCALVVSEAHHQAISALSERDRRQIRDVVELAIEEYCQRHGMGDLLEQLKRAQDEQIPRRQDS